MHSAEFLASHSPADCPFLAGQTAVQQEAYLELIDEFQSNPDAFRPDDLPASEAMTFGADFKNMFSYFQNDSSEISVNNLQTEQATISPDITEPEDEALFRAALEVLRPQSILPEPGPSIAIPTAILMQQNLATEQVISSSTRPNEADTQHVAETTSATATENIPTTATTDNHSELISPAGTTMSRVPESPARVKTEKPVPTIKQTMHVSREQKTVQDKPKMEKPAAKKTIVQPKPAPEANAHQTAHELLIDSEPELFESKAQDNNVEIITTISYEEGTIFEQAQPVSTEAVPETSLETSGTTATSTSAPLEQAFEAVAAEQDDATPETAQAVAVIQQALRQLDAELQANPEAQLELSAELIDALAMALDQAGVEEPEKLIRHYIKSHDIKDLELLLKSEFPDYTKLIDFGYHYQQRALKQFLKQNIQSQPQSLGSFLVSLAKKSFANQAA